MRGHSGQGGPGAPGGACGCSGAREYDPDPPRPTNILDHFSSCSA